MDKSKLSLKEILHQRAESCFDWLSYMDEIPPDHSFGLDESLWKEKNELGKFREIQKLHIDAVEYIKNHKLVSEDFGSNFQEQFLNNKHYLVLSIFGNRIECLLFSELTTSQIMETFRDEDYYYTSVELAAAVEFAQDRIDNFES